MYQFFRKMNQNRKQILVGILVIAFIIFLIQLFNQMAKKNIEEEKNSMINIESSTSGYNSSYSIQSDVTINDNVNKQVNNLIKNFIENCNNGEIEEAYNLLSEDCKEELYPTLENFKTNYYETNFNTKKQYNIQSWISTNNKLTYQVKLYNDILATGKVDNTKTIQDYFTIVTEDGKTKLNIGSYIGKVAIEKEITQNNITIKVNYKKVYMDYEIYNIQIQNKTDYTILLDSNESSKTMYLKGESDNNYTAYMYELTDSTLKLNSYYQKDTNIKYNKQYSASNKIVSVVFSDIILNEEEYRNTENKKDYKNRLEIEIPVI